MGYDEEGGVDRHYFWRLSDDWLNQIDNNKLKCSVG